MRAVIHSVVLGFFFMASFSVAEPPGEKHDEKEKAAAGAKRPKGKWDIDRYTQFLSESLDRKVEPLKRHYGTTLPVALQKVVKEKDESEISAIIAEMLTQRSNAQKGEIVKMAQQVRDAKEGEYTTDAEAIAFMDRLIWAGKGMLGEKVAKDEKNEKFLTAFFGDEKDPKDKGAVGDRMVKNERINEAIKKATDPNSTQADKKAAKELLRGELTRDEAMAFIDSQLKGGNKPKALAVADAIAWKDPSGEKFLEFFRNGKSERLYLGPNEKTMEDALMTYSAKRGGLHNAELAEKEHTTSAPIELVARRGEIQENKRPQGVKPPKMAGSAPVASKVAGGARLVSQGVRDGRPQPPANTGGGGNGAAIFQARCANKCHTTPPGDATTQIAAITSGRMPSQKNSSDPLARPLSGDEKAAIIAYLSKK
jgi:hypothetical protein